MPRLRVQVPGGNVKSIVVPSSQTGGTDPPNGPASATGNVPMTAGQTLIIQQIAKTSALSAGAIATGMLLNANNTWNGANIFNGGQDQVPVAVYGYDGSPYSYGLYIQAGSDSSDYALYVANYDDSAQFLELWGDGHGGIGPSTSLGLSWDKYGAVSVAAAGNSEISFTATGPAGNWAGTFEGNSTAGSSYGLRVQGGTNDSDYAMRVESSPHSDYFAIRGDGLTAATGQIRAGGQYGDTPGSSYTGPAAELGYDGTDAYIHGYNRDIPAYIPAHIDASTVGLWVSGTPALGISAAGLVSLPQLSASTGTTLIESGDAIYSLTSSRDYKVDIEDANEAALTNVLKLRPVWYRSNPKTTSDRPDWGWYGLIAEEVAEIDPRLVNYWDQGRGCERIDRKGKNIGRPVQMKPKSVGYERIAPLLIPHINRLYKKIAALEAKLSTMSTTA